MSAKNDEAEGAAAVAEVEGEEESGNPIHGLSQLEVLRNLLGRVSLGEGGAAQDEKPKQEQLLKELTLEGIADYIKEEKCKKVIIMSGAGISTSAGIPDFRSPGTGLYDNLQKYNLPNPQAIFEIGFFRENPEPFFALSKELFPGAFYPTPSHFFVRLLHEKGILLRHYTQNIDTLDRIAGVPDELIMEAHGSYHTGHCLNCNDIYTEESMREKIMADLIPRCEKCDGVVKPDVVFFGESLPPLFPTLVSEDFPQCDLLIVMGTSLVVQPFASLIDKVPETTPRLLINMEKTGQADPMMMMFGLPSGMDFDSDDKYRDVAYIGPCDEGCQKLAELVGWKKELAVLIKECDKKKKKKSETDKKTVASASPTQKTATSATDKKTVASASPTQKTLASPTKDKTSKTPTSATKNQKAKASASPTQKSPASPTKDKTTKTPTSSTKVQKTKASASPTQKSPASPTKDNTTKTPTSATKNQKAKASASPTQKSPASPTKGETTKTPTSSTKVQKTKASASPTQKTPASPTKGKKPSSKKD